MPAIPATTTVIHPMATMGLATFTMAATAMAASIVIDRELAL